MPSGPDGGVRQGEISNESSSYPKLATKIAESGPIMNAAKIMTCGRHSCLLILLHSVLDECDEWIHFQKSYGAVAYVAPSIDLARDICAGWLYLKGRQTLYFMLCEWRQNTMTTWVYFRT